MEYVFERNSSCRGQAKISTMGRTLAYERGRTCMRLATITPCLVTGRLFKRGGQLVCKAEACAYMMTTFVSKAWEGKEYVWRINFLLGHG